MPQKITPQEERQYDNCNTNETPQDVDLERTTGNQGESDREISIPDTTSIEDGELQNGTNTGSDAIEQDSRGFGEKRFEQKNAESPPEQGGCKAEILREVSTAHSLGENNHRAVRGGAK